MISAQTCPASCGRRSSILTVDDRTGDLRDEHQKNEAEKDDGHAEHNDQGGGTDGDLLHGGIDQKHSSSSSQGAEAP